MSHTVIWLRKAEAALAQLWETNPSARAVITQAAFQVDEILKSEPAEAGESCFGNLRILLVPPLGVTFRFYIENRLVRVGEVWYFAKRRPQPDSP